MSRPFQARRGQSTPGHLALTAGMLEAGLADQLVAAGSLKQVFRLLRAWRGVGDFLGYQMAIDLNYSDVIDHDEDEFVVAGPGALDGLSSHGRG